MATDIQVAVRQGRAHQEAGRLGQAEQIYRQILAVEPNEPQTLFLLGVLAGQCGHHEQAVELIGRSVKSDPTSVEAQFNYGIALASQHVPMKAAEAFRAAIGLKPDFAAAHGNLGLALCELGQVEEAIAAYQRAVRIKPDYADAYSNLGAALIRQGQYQEAVNACRRAIELRPDYAAAHSNLGGLLREMGQLEEAVAACRRALAINPGLAETQAILDMTLNDLAKSGQSTDFSISSPLESKEAEAQNDLGHSMRQQGRLEEAMACYRKAAELKPDYAWAYVNLGNVALDMGRYEEAVAAYRQAIAVNPRMANAHCNFGAALMKLGKLDAAVGAFERALALEPNLAEAGNNLGLVLRDQGKLDQAAAALERAIEINPEFDKAYCNLGMVLRSQGKIEEAVRAGRRAVEINADYPMGYSNLGNALADFGQVDEAMKAFSRAIELEPDMAAAHFNLAMGMLLQGDMTRGWSEYEWRWKCKELPVDRRPFTQPAWDGGELGGRRILLMSEQGLGDTIQFIRYVPLVKARGGRIIIESKAPLIRLLKQNSGGDPGEIQEMISGGNPGGNPGGIPGVDQWVIRGEPLPPFDVHCHLLSLPLAFGTTVETIPAQVPLLQAPADGVEQWRSRIASLGRGLKVGLAWAGSPTNTNDRKRSIRLEKLAALGQASHVRFVSLQKGVAVEQARELPPGFSLADWTDELNDFADTAALIANLDLVICVDTSVAHLAGAMGKSVWVLLPFAPDWRWMLDRSDSPWYPTMRLFRQPMLGDWETPISQVLKELTAMKR